MDPWLLAVPRIRMRAASPQYSASQSILIGTHPPPQQRAGADRFLPRDTWWGGTSRPDIHRRDFSLVQHVDADPLGGVERVEHCPAAPEEKRIRSPKSHVPPSGGWNFTPCSTIQFSMSLNS